MGRRHLPVLLGARMQYRLQVLEAALHKPESERCWEELHRTWSNFGHVIEETHTDLSTRIDASVTDLGAALQQAPSESPQVRMQLQGLGSLLRELV